MLPAWAASRTRTATAAPHGSQNAPAHAELVHKIIAEIKANENPSKLRSIKEL